MSKPSYVVDPFNDKQAVDHEGRILGQVRILPAGTLPTVANIAAAPVVGYGRAITDDIIAVRHTDEGGTE